MKRTELAYIGLELGTHRYPEDLSSSGMDDILDEGIECYPEDIYAILYEGYDCEEEHIKMMLDEPDNSKNMLYPLSCYRDLSYDKWLEYKKDWEEMDREEEEKRRKARLG